MVCLVGMEGSRDVEPLREVQRMSWRLAINSIGSRSTGSGEGDPERWGEGKSKQRKRREWKRGGITGRDMMRRWRGVKGHTVIAHLNACNYSKQACKTNEGWNSTLINCILGLCCTFCVHVLTIFGFAGAVIWLQQVSLHTAAGVGALSVCARLTARPVHIALIEIYKKITLCITISFYWVCFDTTFLVLGNKRERLLLNLITNIYLLPWGKCFDKKMTCCCTQVPVSKHKVRVIRWFYEFYSGLARINLANHPLTFTCLSICSNLIAVATVALRPIMSHSTVKLAPMGGTAWCAFWGTERQREAENIKYCGG